ncbi:TPA: sensor histidine kinase [Burkholderia aenigmatica]|uniref:sensor histidine kinase n=1 Tax=Burkholderia sp. AU45251 TaxID=3059204 RepID=UPI00264E321E|nr:sensor histidine kinase [Burkholderia sp. AU45251]HDR9482313.1 sensor histidine kinase [Burkholderia aenigmatica]MDN7515049.1 sensor histidine kinase [Burkholderia sp. AU45251]HDR9514619.1 sensor histidine kinase [Burkholderia aenigmatica]HDR9590684.1 sensor histidine kinase [Burkholderia aenigmatica]HDR9599840.1 sensor histidine kinase [Burkholderia aenigmatica]
MRRRHVAWATGCRAVLLLLIAMAVTCATARAASAPNPAQLDAVSVFEDASTTMSADQVAARLADPGHGTLLAATSSFNVEFSRSAWWIRATLTNRDSATRALVLAIRDARVDQTDFYIGQHGRWTLDSRFPAAGTGGDAAPPSSRYPVLDVTLRAGESIPVLIRVTSRKEMRLAPAAFTHAAWDAQERRATMWDFGFFGGLLALVWCALLIGFFSRSGVFHVLAAMALGTTLFEAAYRGYPAMALPPALHEWSARGEVIFAYLAVACFIVFILMVARREQARLPMRAIYMAFLALEGVGMVGAAGGDLLTFTWFCLRLNAVLGIVNISLALMLAIRRTPTGRVMLIAIGFATFNMLMRVLDGMNTLPPALSWLKSDIYPNPVIAIVGLATHLLVLAAWIHHVGRQRTEARTRLEHWQITEQDRLRDEVARRTVALNDALQQVTTHMQQKIETLGYVSHDLRAPLSTINGYAKLLLQSATRSQAQLIRSIDRSIRYQLALIDELLAFTKTELQPLGVAPDATDLPGLLDDIGHYALALCAQQDNRFVYRPATPLPRTVSIDGMRLQQVLLNLLSNASKFTRDGTVTLSIHASREGDAWRLLFEVTDTGIGIDISGTRDIFRAYQQVQAVNGGTGLGLFIAQRIVGAMGGELAVASQPGAGTAFSFAIVAPAVEHALVPASELVRRFHPDRDAEPDRAAPPMQGPPDDALAELIRLADNGQLTDIEDWLGQYADEPDYAAFVQDVRERLDALDLTAIGKRASALQRARIADTSFDAEMDAAGPA